MVRIYQVAIMFDKRACTCLCAPADVVPIREPLLSWPNDFWLLGLPNHSYRKTARYFGVINYFRFISKSRKRSSGGSLSFYFQRNFWVIRKKAPQARGQCMPFAISGPCGQARLRLKSF